MTVDTRSYSQIWEDLETTERSMLTCALMKSLSCSDSTLRNYKLQNRTPRKLYQITIAKTIKRTLGIPVHCAYLFPDSEYAKTLRKKLEK